MLKETLMFPGRSSAHPDKFPGIFIRTHGRNGLKLAMLMYTSHIQNRLDFEQGLLRFRNLATLWLSETGQLGGFRACSCELMAEVPEMRHADVSWTSSELIRFWSRSVRFPLFGPFWLSEISKIWAFVAFAGERMGVNVEQGAEAYLWRFTSGFFLVAKWYEEFCGIQLLGPAFADQIDGLVHNCSISLANALEKLQSCTKPSIYLLQYM